MTGSGRNPSTSRLKSWKKMMQTGPFKTILQKPETGKSQHIGDATPPFGSPLEDSRINRAGITLPLVSIIVTNDNDARYVVETLGSVARQTYPHWECIVVDDVSADNSREQIRSFLQAPDTPSEKFRIIEREENGGQLRAFMDGLEHASGVFVVMLDSDDVLLEDFLETHVRHHLGSHPVAFTSSNQYQIDGNGAVVSGDHADHQSKGALRYISSATFQRGYWIWATASSMMFRAETLKLILPRDGTTFRICADYYMAHFCNLLGSSMLIPTIHGCYRRHGRNNFGSHPVLGAINAVGDLNPPHDSFRKAIIQHVLSYHTEFEPILTTKGFVIFFLKITRLREFFKIVNENRHLFPESKCHYLKEFVRYRLNRLKIRKPYRIKKVAIVYRRWF